MNNRKKTSLFLCLSACAAALGLVSNVLAKQEIASEEQTQSLKPLGNFEGALKSIQSARQSLDFALTHPVSEEAVEARQEQAEATLLEEAQKHAISLPEEGEVPQVKEEVKKEIQKQVAQSAFSKQPKLSVFPDALKILEQANARMKLLEPEFQKVIPTKEEREALSLNRLRRKNPKAILLNIQRLWQFLNPMKIKR